MSSPAPEPTGRSFSVRRTTEGDLEAIMDLTELVAAEGRWIGTSPGFDRAERIDRFRQVLATPDAAVSIVAVAPDEAGADQVIGNLGLTDGAPGVAVVGMLVAEGWRGRGVGTALLGEGVTWARGAGKHKVALELWPSNTAALALYLRIGFVVEGRLVRHYRRPDGALWDSLVMGLVLDHDAPGSPFQG